MSVIPCIACPACRGIQAINPRPGVLMCIDCGLCDQDGTRHQVDEDLFTVMRAFLGYPDCPMPDITAYLLGGAMSTN